MNQSLVIFEIGLGVPNEVAFGTLFCQCRIQLARTCRIAHFLDEFWRRITKASVFAFVENVLFVRARKMKTGTFSE
jgi:hypothetical protein